MANSTQREAVTAKLQAKQDLILRLMELSHCPGLSVAVLWEGETILCQGYGLADVTKQVLAAADTIYPIASVSKAFAATACGVLVEEGHLSWDDTISCHFPEFSPIHAPDAARKITFIDVLSHQSGLRDQPCLHQGPNGLPLFDNEATLLSVINALPSEIGAFRRVWQYSPLPYALVGPLVKRMTGETLAEFLTSRIFRPLGMSSTSVAGTLADDSSIQRLAQPYTATASGELIARNVSPKAYQFPVNAAMGIWSSAADMMQWAKAVIEAYRSPIGGENLTESSPKLPQMATILHRWCPLPPGPAGSPAYCLGWFSTRGYHISDDIFDPDDDSSRVLPLPIPTPGKPPQNILFHSGTGNGCSSSLTVYPDTASAVVVLANSSLCGDAADAVALVLTAALQGYEVDEAALERSVTANTTWETGRWLRVRKELDKVRNSSKTEDRAWRPDQIVGVYCNKMGLEIHICTTVKQDQDHDLTIRLGISDAQLPLRLFCANTMCFLPDEHDFQALGLGYMGHGCQFLIHLYFSKDTQHIAGIWWQHDPMANGAWFSLRAGGV